MRQAAETVCLQNGHLSHLCVEEDLLLCWLSWCWRILFTHLVRIQDGRPDCLRHWFLQPEWDLAKSAWKSSKINESRWKMAIFKWGTSYLKVNKKAWLERRVVGWRHMLLLFSYQGMSDSWRPHGLQRARPPCSSPSPGACSSSCPFNQWCHLTISSSLSSSPPAFNLSQHQGLFQWVGSSHQVAKVWELQLQHQNFQRVFRVDFF